MQDENAVVAVAGAASLPRLFIRSALGLPVAAVFLWLLAGRLADTEPALIFAALNGISIGSWLLALFFAAISFAAIGEYDRLFHRISGTAIPAIQARVTGMAAMALAQMLGLGVLSGALVRWRLVASFDLWSATRFSAFVSMSFLVGFGAFTAAVILVSPSVPTLPPYSVALSVMAVCGVAVLALATALLRRLSFRGKAVCLPPLARLARVFIIVAVDCLGAAACAWVLMPDDVMAGFSAFLPVFLLALGAGLVSGAPAGVGAYDVMLLALIPHAEGGESLLAAALAFRLVYFVLPALAAMLLMMRGPGDTAGMTPSGEQEKPSRSTSVKPAEAYLSGQGWFDLLYAGKTALLVAPTGQALVSLGDASGLPRHALSALSGSASAQDRFPCLYKIGPRLAATARRDGYSVLRIAEEALIDPQRFDVSAPASAGLRRKLRKAETAGVEVCQAKDTLPIRSLNRINDEWAKAHGGERGFSMGRYAPEHLPSRIVLVARHGEQIAGFVTFAVETGTEGPIWRLDLMRHLSSVAEGTMHALIVHAIALAKDHGVVCLSLAAVPAAPPDGGKYLSAPVWPRLLVRITRRLGGGGLRQFKQGFAPRWNPLYIAAPGCLRLCVAGAEIAAAIVRPGPPPRSAAPRLPVCLEPRSMS